MGRSSLKNFFSVKNIEEYKVFTFFGFSFKFKNRLLAQKVEFYKALDDRSKEFEYKLCKYMPEEKYSEYLKDWFSLRTGQTLNLDNPVTFNEKIQWLKLHDSTPLKTRLADKYLVRDWIKEKVGEQYLIPLLGVWEKFDDIDFNKLPDKFVLKANHGCGWNIIVKDKSKFDKKEAQKKFDKWMQTNFAYCAGLELHYKNIKPLIIAEEYIEEVDSCAIDYKFICFDGNPELCWVSDKSKNIQERSFYNMDWVMQDIELVEPHKVQAKEPVEKPQNLAEMIKIAKELSRGFAFVRVDLYKLLDGTLKFGELTFTSASGVSKWSSYDIDKKLGDLINIEALKNSKVTGE